MLGTKASALWRLRIFPAPGFRNPKKGKEIDPVKKQFIRQISDQISHAASNRPAGEINHIPDTAAVLPTIEPLDRKFSVCRLRDFSQADWSDPFCFAGKTDREYSFVCGTEKIPRNVLCHDDGWRAFRICGTLDFSLIGILAGIADILAKNESGLFAVSTYDTDYILVKQENFQRALHALRQEGYPVLF